MLTVGITCWIGENIELPALKRCLESVKNLPVILVNGKWSDMEGDYPTSTPETNELIDSYSNVTHIRSPNKTEAENRTIMFNECKTEYMLYLDTDEWCVFPRGIRQFVNNMDIEKVGYVNYYDEGRGGDCKMIRLVRNPHKLKLKTHNEFMVNPEPVTDGLVIHSDRLYKSEKRKNAMLKRNRDNPIH